MKPKRTVLTRDVFSTIGACISWFAVGLQFYLIIVNRTASLPETIVRFLSFFTILTNTLIALFFTSKLWSIKSKISLFFSRSSPATAVTVYITVVGLVYQFLLRHLWSPQGLQWMADELLHSVIPLFAIIYWWNFTDKSGLRWNDIPGWLIYPIFYLVYILIRGATSGFYPYPFVDVTALGYRAVALNSCALLAGFVLLSAFFVLIGRLFSQKPRES